MHTYLFLHSIWSIITWIIWSAEAKLSNGWWYPIHLSRTDWGTPASTSNQPGATMRACTSALPPTHSAKVAILPCSELLVTWNPTWGCCTHQKSTWSCNNWKFAAFYSFSIAEWLFPPTPSFPESPIIVTFSGHVSSRIGASVDLPCHAVGILPINYTWSRGKAKARFPIGPPGDRYIGGELKQQVHCVARWNHFKKMSLFGLTSCSCPVQGMERCTFPTCSSRMLENISVLLRTEEGASRGKPSSPSQVKKSPLEVTVAGLHYLFSTNMQVNVLIDALCLERMNLQTNVC